MQSHPFSHGTPRAKVALKRLTISGGVDFVASEADRTEHIQV
jgi:hypothetical protein